MPKITIDLDRVAQLKQAGKDYVFEAGAEAALVELLQMQASVDEAVDYARHAVAEAGLALSPDFSGVQSDKLRANYSFHGSIYTVVAGEADPEFAVKKVSYSPLRDAIEHYAETHGMLPVGVIKNERVKSMTLTLKTPKAKKEAGNDEKEA
jgi:hypothetical protein